MELIDKALQFAAYAHREQRRKGSDTPYISHPAAVGMLLLKHGYGEEVVAAGILHDTVEDTDTSYEELEREFGKKVSEIVAGCSEPDKSLSWEERKEHTIEYLKTAANEIRAVACADKLHNVMTIRRDFEKLGNEIWGRFNRGRDKQEWYYRSLLDSFASGSALPMFADLQNEVERLFGIAFKEL